jgi:asparagine synthase (glutamine-hydrolysing)
MFRYLALVWNARDQQHGSAAQSLADRLRARTSPWKTVGNWEGLRVYSTGAKAGSPELRLLQNHCGIVIGTLFERHSDVEDDTPSRSAVLDPPQTESILASRGRWLTNHCWGDYVAFLRDPSTGIISILKDPTGSLPCYHAEFRGVSIFFSCITGLVSIDALTPLINHNYLRMRVVDGNATLEQSALDGVSQVHRGECLEIDTRRQPAIIRRTQYWSPQSFTHSQDSIDDPRHAACALRATVRACTQSWAGCHDSLLHRLSGGLDSSIIIGCLKDAVDRPHITSYTYYNPNGRSDERPWARLAANSANCKHVEIAVTPADIDLKSILRMSGSVEPAPVLGYTLRYSVERPLADDLRATAVFCGDGGDSGFCSDSLAYVVPEYLRRVGLRAEAIRLAGQVALCTDRSTWAVLARAFREQFSHNDAHQYPTAAMAGCQLVSRDVREAMDVKQHHRHPWFRDVEHTPWALIRRLGTLLCSPDYYSGLSPEDCAPEVVAPLYSQPALELLLRIPIYRHFEGRDRGLARRAFAQEVPAPILRRIWKDRAAGFHSEVIRRNRPFLRELFLDGALVGEGLLDRAAVEISLSSSPHKSTVLPGELFKHLDVELWARHWLRCARRRAAA